MGESQLCISFIFDQNLLELWFQYYYIATTLLLGHGKKGTMNNYRLPHPNKNEAETCQTCAWPSVLINSLPVILPVRTGFDRFWSVFTGKTCFDRFLTGNFDRYFYRIWPVFTGFDRFLPDFTGFYRIWPFLPDLTGIFTGNRDWLPPGN